MGKENVFATSEIFFRGFMVFGVCFSWLIVPTGAATPAATVFSTRVIKRELVRSDKRGRKKRRRGYLYWYFSRVGLPEQICFTSFQNDRSKHFCTSPSRVIIATVHSPFWPGTSSPCHPHCSGVPESGYSTQEIYPPIPFPISKLPPWKSSSFFFTSKARDERWRSLHLPHM